MTFLNVVELVELDDIDVSEDPVNGRIFGKYNDEI